MLWAGALVAAGGLAFGFVWNRLSSKKSSSGQRAEVKQLGSTCHLANDPYVIKALRVCRVSTRAVVSCLAM